MTAIGGYSHRRHRLGDPVTTMLWSGCPGFCSKADREARTIRAPLRRAEKRHPTLASIEASAEAVTEKIAVTPSAMRRPNPEEDSGGVGDPAADRPARLMRKTGTPDASLESMIEEVRTVAVRLESSTRASKGESSVGYRRQLT